MPANSGEEILGVSLCRPDDGDDQGGESCFVSSLGGKRTWQRQGLAQGALLPGSGGIFNLDHIK